VLRTRLSLTRLEERETPSDIIPLDPIGDLPPPGGEPPPAQTLPDPNAPIDPYGG
jgi:hypothetical protein